MAVKTRELINSPVLQGVDEEIAYVIATPAGTAPTTVSVVVKDTTDTTTVTGTVMPTNTPSASVDTITLSPLKLLTAAHEYRVEVKFTSGANVYEVYFRVEAET